jgi:uncharacterized protein
VTLRLEQRRSRKPAEWSEGRFVVQAEREWLLSGPADELQDAVQALPGVSEQIDAGIAVLAFGNSVGQVHVPGLGVLDVISGKWSERDYESMLMQLTEIAANLPFSAGEATALPYERSAASDDVLYHAFVYLRYILADATPSAHRLEDAARVIFADPHRRWLRTGTYRQPHEIARVDDRMLMDLVRSPSGLAMATSPEWAATSLAAALRGHVPDRLYESRVEATLDTLENRFVKAFLEQAGALIRSLEERLVQHGNAALQRRVRADCAAMSAKLDQLRGARIWREVGTMTHIPAASTVLHRKRGYRDVFRHFSRLRLAARLPLERRSVNDLLELKNIAELYELWCFFRVASELETILGKPTSAERPQAKPMKLVVPWDLRVTWAGRAYLDYNRKFSRAARRRSRSFSLPLRPDITLEVLQGPSAGLHLLDAKFRLDRRIERRPDGVDGGALRGDDAEEEQSSFKPSDLHKMHAYRDAIRDAGTAWVLYPGKNYRFFAAPGAMGGVEGVGAVPLQPAAAEAAELRAALRSVLGY